MLSLDYLAGIVDGEGCLGIYRCTGHRSYYIRVNIANMHKPMLQQIQDGYGGRFKRHPDSGVYYLVWDATPARDLIKLLEPVLIVKQNQAQLILEFASLNPRAQYKLSDDEIETRECYRQALREMKAERWD